MNHREMKIIMTGEAIVAVQYKSSAIFVDRFLSAWLIIFRKVKTYKKFLDNADFSANIIFGLKSGLSCCKVLLTILCNSETVGKNY